MTIKKITDEKDDEENVTLQQRALVLQKALGIPVKVNIEENLYVVELQEKNSFDKKPEIKYLYGLREKTRSDFKDILKNYNKEKIKSFINHIESDIGNVVGTRRKLGNWQHTRAQNLKDIIELLERANKYLLKIYSGRLEVPLQPKHSYAFKFENPNDPLSGDLYQLVGDTCKFNSKITFNLLQNLIRNLKSAVAIERKNRGRPRSDEDDLAFQIAKWFQGLIGTPHPFSGPFPEIVERCFEIAGIKGGREGDRTRTIRQALKRLSSPYPIELV